MLAITEMDMDSQSSGGIVIKKQYSDESSSILQTTDILIIVMINRPKHSTSENFSRQIIITWIPLEFRKSSPTIKTLLFIRALNLIIRLNIPSKLTFTLKRSFSDYHDWNQLLCASHIKNSKCIHSMHERIRFWHRLKVAYEVFFMYGKHSRIDYFFERIAEWFK